MIVKYCAVSSPRCKIHGLDIDEAGAGEEVKGDEVDEVDELESLRARVQRMAG